MAEIIVTLRQILDTEPCYNPYQKNLVSVDHNLDAPITFREIAEKINPNDLVWYFYEALPDHDTLKRHFAIDCVERIIYLIDNKHSRNALTVARKYALGQATDNELRTARDMIRDFAWDTTTNTEDNAAWNAIYATVWSTAWAAAKNASWYAVKAHPTQDAKSDEAKWQANRIIQLTEAGEWSPITQDL